MQKATTFAVAKRATRRYLRSMSGWAARASRQKNATAATALTSSSPITLGAPNPAVSAVMIANTRVASTAAPSSAPAVSTRYASGSALSGRITAPSTRAARPNNRLNQKMARQFHAPTSAPPITGPSARARPDTAAQMPMARSRLRRSVYRCRSMDSVPGSLAAAPSPMTARPAISTPGFGASAHSTDPAQKTPAPDSMTILRPSSSPIIPQASMTLAKVRA